MAAPLLEVSHLSKTFRLAPKRFLGAKQQLRAVDDVSFSVHRGETLGIVGESGCGKSTLGKMVAQLLTPTAGHISIDGEDLTPGNSSRRSQVRRSEMRRRIQMVFQDPSSSLNPRRTIGASIAAPFMAQRITPPGGVANRVRDLMDRVGLKPEHINRFPHEFSGGQKQRVGIARALALSPDIIICDEPVSALDVSVQAQVVNLLEDIQSDTGVALVFIAHDLSVVKHISDRVGVMYLGRLMESGPVAEVMDHPRHPYTQSLLSSVPNPDPNERGRERIVLRGELPNPANPPSGCPFRTRCPLYLTLSDSDQAKCSQSRPTASATEVACHFSSLPSPV